MRKFTLLIASLFITMGAMAQTEIGTQVGVENLENNAVYTIQGYRGGFRYMYNNGNALKTTTNAYDNQDTYKWCIYKSNNGVYYLYSLGASRFLGNTPTLVEDGPVSVEFVVKNSASTLSTPLIMMSADNGTAAMHTANAGTSYNITNWSGAFSNLSSNECAFKVTKVAELDELILNTIETAVVAYENTALIPARTTELQSMVTEFAALYESIEIGNGLGQYIATDPDYLAKYNAIAEYSQNIPAEATVSDIDAKIAELKNLLASFVLNMPVENKYYRISRKANPTSYLVAGTDNTSGRTRFSTTSSDNVFFYTGGKLLSYSTGYYINSDGSFQTYTTTVNQGVAIAFAPATSAGYYNIQFGGNRYLYAGSDNGTSDAAGAPAGEFYEYNIEEVTELPVTITAAGYATLFAPVALTVPSEVKAYTVTINGEWATLNEITSGIIPANTGVVIAGANGEAATAGTYNFAITTTEATATSALRGSVATTYYTEAGTYYALAQVDEVVGFYKDAFNNSRFQNNSHKAYLYVASEGAEAASYSFRFGEGTTGISEVKGESENVKVIYDLTGRRVENPSNGIYIINGVKTLVK